MHAVLFLIAVGSVNPIPESSASRPATEELIGECREAHSVLKRFNEKIKDKLERPYLSDNFRVAFCRLRDPKDTSKAEDFCAQSNLLKVRSYYAEYAQMMSVVHNAVAKCIAAQTKAETAGEPPKNSKWYRTLSRTAQSTHEWGLSAERLCVKTNDVIGDLYGDVPQQCPNERRKNEVDDTLNLDRPF